MDLQKRSETGKQHPAESFITAPFEPEKNEVSSPASTFWKGKVAPTRQRGSMWPYPKELAKGGQWRSWEALLWILGNVPKQGNSTQLKVSPALQTRPQSLMPFSEPEKMKFQSQQAPRRQKGQRDLNQRNWHQQASEGLGQPCCGLGQRSETGKQHPAEGFTGPTKPQTAVSNSLSEPEKNEVSSPASTNAPKRFNVTLTKGTGNSRPVQVLGSLAIDLRKRSKTGKQH